jgi:hypothetical protein
MSNNPQDLEPKSGDYVRYINELQAGKIRDLAGVRAGVVTQNASGQVQVKSAREVAMEEQAAADSVVRARIERTNAIMRLIGPSILTCGLLCFASGIAYEIEEVIPLGMALMFVGFVATAKLRDRIRGR